jgi:protein involved in polysaccharide export with SLBB domain
MEKELIKLYDKELQSKEVNVAVESSVYRVYVIGAVLKPGKIEATRPLNAFEAIMEAGGFDPSKADLRSVSVIRRENGNSKRYTLNLKRLIEGDQVEPFPVKPEDIISVPEKFNWF